MSLGGRQHLSGARPGPPAFGLKLNGYWKSPVRIYAPGFLIRYRVDRRSEAYKSSPVAGSAATGIIQGSWLAG